MKKQWIDLNSDMGEGFGHGRSAGRRQDIMPLISLADIAASGFTGGRPRHMAIPWRWRSAMTSAWVRIRAIAISLGSGAETSARQHRNWFMTSSIRSVRCANSRIFTVSRSRTSNCTAHCICTQPPTSSLPSAIAAMRRLDPELPVFCMSGTHTHRCALDAGQPVACEFFADRDYDDSGSIVFTRQVGVMGLQRVAEKVIRACVDGVVETVSGNDIEIDFQRCACTATRRERWNSWRRFVPRYRIME